MRRIVGMPRIAFDSDVPDSTIEQVYEKLGCDEAHIVSNKTLDLGWKNLESPDAKALGEILKKAVNCVNLK